MNWLIGIQSHLRNLSNTHNSRNGASEINSAYSAYSAVKNLDKGKSIASQNFKTEFLEPASNHNEENKHLIQSVIDWVGHCEPGEEWQMLPIGFQIQMNFAKLQSLMFVNDSPT